MQSRQLDIHLLLVFEAILSERNITRAAQRVNLSQSATSKALARLREVFGDPLFLRIHSGVAPTHRALELAPRIQQTLDAARALLNPRAEFNPADAVTVFNIAASDYVSFIIMPVLLPLLARVGPGIRIVVHDLDVLTAEVMLLSGKVDLALASVVNVSTPLHRQQLFQDEYVCMARHGHPEIHEQITLAQFVSLRHLVIPRQNGGGLSIVDDALSQCGLTREAVVTIPHFLGIPKILANTDLLLTVPARVGNSLAESFPIRVYRHPLELATFVVSQLWHSRTDNSPSHEWLRTTIAELCRRI